MGLINAFNELRVRAMADIGSIADFGAEPWKLLDDLGLIGQEARPVIIQGGLSTDAYLYEPLKRLLTELGFDVTVTHLDMHGFAPFQDDAANLAVLVREASERSLTDGGDGLVNIIAHSKGGLSSRWFMQKMGGAEHVAQLVTLGTPHNGSIARHPLAALQSMTHPLKSIRQLSSHSRDIRALNRDLPAFMARVTGERPDFRIVSVAGDMHVPGAWRTDGTVTVREARLDDRIAGIYNIVVRDKGAHHMAISGQIGQNEPTLRVATLLLGDRTPAEASNAARGAMLLTPRR